MLKNDGEIKKYYDQNKDKVEYFKHTLLEKKAIKLIMKNSTIEEVEPELTEGDNYFMIAGSWYDGLVPTAPDEETIVISGGFIPAHTDTINISFDILVDSQIDITTKTSVIEIPFMPEES